MRTRELCLVLLVGILLSSFPLYAAPVHQWSQRFGSAGFDEGNATAVDGSGNVVVVGNFEGTVDFGGGPLTSAGNADIFVAKYDASGVHQWSQRFGSTGSDSGIAVAVDVSGNVVVTGNFFGTVDFGGGPLTSAGNGEIFVAKYNASGVHQWSQRFGSTDTDGYDYGFGVAVDGSGNVVVAGAFFGTVDFGGGPLTSAGIDIFVAKFDASGVHQWSQRFGSPGDDEASAIAVDGAGNVVVAGAFFFTVDFGGGLLFSSGIWDVFVAKYDADGVHQWSKSFGSTGIDVAAGIAVDGAGNVVVTGKFIGTVDFGGGPLTSAGAEEIFVAKYNASGVHQWSRRFGSTGSEIGTAVAVYGSGNVAVTGFFDGLVDLGGGPLTSAGDWDIFVAKYTASGVHQWSQRFGSTNGDFGAAVAVDGAGNAVVTGDFKGTVDFGGGPLTSAGSADIYVVKFVEDLLSNQVLYGVTWPASDGASMIARRYSIDTTTGAAANALVTGVPLAIGIARAPGNSNEAYAISASNGGNSDLYRFVDLTTGTATLVGSLGVPLVEGDLAFDSSGQLYAVSQLGSGSAPNKMYQINLATGAATNPVDITGSPNSPTGFANRSDFSAMSFDPAGNLWMLDNSIDATSFDTYLLRVNPTNGNAVTSLQVSQRLGGQLGMAFDSAGNLYVADGGALGTGKLYRLDSTTGALTEVGSFGLPGTEWMSGLTFATLPAKMVPGLSSLSLIFLGVLLLAVGAFAIGFERAPSHGRASPPDRLSPPTW